MRCEWREIGALFRLAGDGSDVPELPGVRVHRRATTLEDAFLSLTGKELREE